MHPEHDDSAFALGPKQSQPDHGAPDHGAPDHGAPDHGPAAHGNPAARRSADVPLPSANGRPPIRTGRNLPVAIGVGVVLGGLAILTLFTVKATFLLYVGVIIGIALWEFGRALGSRDISLALIPVLAGTAAMLTLAYWVSARDALAALAVTFVVLLAWRLRGGALGYVRDVTASVFALAWIALMAVFVALMLAQPDGARRVLLFLIVTVCSDIGGYFAGILAGRHPMAPTISPKKTWEGLAGSVAACLAAGAIGLTELLHGHVWQGLLLGLAAAAAATLGDLAESMIKRDLQIKDMGTVLPGHGGVLDRIDSLLIMAPVVWLLLAAFIPA